MKPIRLAVILAGSALVAGCFSTGAKHRPIVDGSDPEEYETDLAACQAVARQHPHMNEDTKLDTSIGAAVGGIAGAVTGGVEGAVTGAAAGAAGSAAQGSRRAVDERKGIVTVAWSTAGTTWLSEPGSDRRTPWLTPRPA